MSSNASIAASGNNNKTHSPLNSDFADRQAKFRTLQQSSSPPASQPSSTASSVTQPAPSLQRETPQAQQQPSSSISSRRTTTTTAANNNNDNKNRRDYFVAQSLFTIPRPIKQIFDLFPLRTYPANELPLRAPRGRDEHVLYIFTNDGGEYSGDYRDTRKGKPSFNPGCLKWQAYLKFREIAFRTVSSSNHASPNGILPFLIPAVEMDGGGGLVAGEQAPIPSTRLQKWADGQRQWELVREREKSGSDASGSDGGNGLPTGRDLPEESDANALDGIRAEAYMSLINMNIRRAWLYALYLTPSNFTTVAYPRYIQPCSSNTFVQASLASTLRNAAVTELLKHSAVIDADEIYRAADEAFDAFAVQLSEDHQTDSEQSSGRVEDRWLFGAQKPGLADAALFAYTHLLLDENMEWQDRRMVDMVERKRREGLVRHRERILREYF